METPHPCEEGCPLSPGQTGEACPRGGGERPEERREQHLPGPRHPAVLTLALTFCGGLILLHLAASVLVPQWLPLSPGYKALVSRLQSIIALATVLYLVLRRAEGDFRALFIVALGLFAATEGLGALARGYGFITANEMAKPFNVVLFIFSSLGLSAAIADGWRPEPYRVALVVANASFLFLSALRGAIEVRGGELNDKANLLFSGVLAVVVLCVAAAVFRGETRAPVAAPAACAPAGAAGPEAAAPREQGQAAAVEGEQAAG